MAIIRLDQTHYATQTKKNQVIEAMQSWGEQGILLHTNNVSIDQDHTQRCPDCWDEVYAQSEYECTTCYGTTFSPPFKNVNRIWSLFENTQKRESTNKRGEYIADSRTVYLEGVTSISPGDFFVRVREWDVVHRPVVLGDRYRIDDINESNLRTGAKYAQEPNDRLGQRVQVSRMPSSHPIYQYVIDPMKPVGRPDAQWLGGEI